MSRLEIHPLTPDRWSDLVTLFGPRGACGGCWCMHPRLTGREYDQGKGEANKKALKRLVDAGQVPGVLAYRDGEPVAWCAIEPRSAYPRLQRSRVLRAVDDRPVWSIVCLFVRKDARRQGVSRRVIDGAVAWARSQGATLVEAYPVEPRSDSAPDVFLYYGVARTFAKVGFREVERRSPTRPIMRRTLRRRRSPGGGHDDDTGP